MLELFIFLIVLAIIRGWRRPRFEPRRSTRIDVYHHWSPSGPGEPQLLEDLDIYHQEEPLVLEHLAPPSSGGNVVPLRRRLANGR